MRSATQRARRSKSFRSPARRCCARCARRTRGHGVRYLQPSSLEDLGEGTFVHGGTEVVPLLREGILAADVLVDVRGVVPRGVRGNVIGAGTTLAELELDP